VQRFVANGTRHSMWLAYKPPASHQVMGFVGDHARIRQAPVKDGG